MQPVLRVAAIHDISGFGRASLTVAIPVLSVMGIQTCPLPTAVLSTQTSGMTGFTFLDLTEQMGPIMDHWDALGLRFNAVYSGFLGSPQQSSLVERVISDFLLPGGLAVVDPVLGDNGRLDPTQTPEMVQAMRSLIAHADVITPNATEAAFLLGEQWRPDISPAGLKDQLRALYAMGPSSVVITSAPWKDNTSIATIAFDGKRFWSVSVPRVNAYYPGTGDAFASALTGCLILGDSLPLAVDRAAHFVLHSIRLTYGYDIPPAEGVLLERSLPFLRETFVGGCHEEF